MPAQLHAGHDWRASSGLSPGGAGPQNRGGAVRVVVVIGMTHTVWSTGASSDGAVFADSVRPTWQGTVRSLTAQLRVSTSRQVRRRCRLVQAVTIRPRAGTVTAHSVIR